jgi:hypothetical protein
VCEPSVNNGDRWCQWLRVILFPPQIYMANTPCAQREWIWWEMQWKRGWQVGWKKSGWQLFARLIRFVAVGAKGFWLNCASLAHTRRGYMCFAWNRRARALVKYCSHAGPMRHNASSLPSRVGLDFFSLFSGAARRKYNKLHDPHFLLGSARRPESIFMAQSFSLKVLMHGATFRSALKFSSRRKLCRKTV